MADQGEVGSNSTVKRRPDRRKRGEFKLLKSEERYVKVDDLRQELQGLFSYHRELAADKLDFDQREFSSTNSVVACLLEESPLSFSKLVSEIFQKMKERVQEGSENGVTLASVKSYVHLLGQRVSYGLTNLDADLFEDETDSYFWCWETRDVKLLPKSLRGMVKIRRTCRRKIHERIGAVSDMITALQKSEALHNHGHELKKASERLSKVLNEAEIRSLVRTLVEKNSADMTDTKLKKEEQKLIKEMEKSKREEEKEKKRKNQELLKEKWHSENEMKRLQSEAANEERKRQREEAETRKLLKRKQEDMEKEQRRREKEEAEHKEKIMLQKQVSFMYRYFKRSKNSSTSPNGQSSSFTISIDSSPKKENEKSESVCSAMDHILLTKDEMNFDDILKKHILAWRSFRSSNHPSRKKHWGMRQKPTSELVKKTKLSTGKALVGEDELNLEKLDRLWGETHSDERSNNAIPDSSVPCSQKPKRHKQLLQFDKSNRPAFYGIWTKKSQVIGSRRPFKKDPELDYEIDSDEEWEEEEPGESLSDCDKDVEDEILEEGISKADCEDYIEDDGFLVPDGYLSEDEGIRIDGEESNCIINEADGLPHCKVDEQKLLLFLSQQKHMQKLTDHALRRNQPFIISNLNHEKASLMMAEDLVGTSKLEQLCLQSLSMYQFPGCLCISAVHDEDDENSSLSKNKESAITLSPDMPDLSDSELREIVSTIQSCQHSTNDVLESLQQKFPSIPKSQLEIKACEISDFVDNQWQVKKDVLNKLGFSSSSESSSGRTKIVADLFSIRCLPQDDGDGKSIGSNMNSSL